MVDDVFDLMMRLIWFNDAFDLMMRFYFALFVLFNDAFDLI